MQTKNKTKQNKKTKQNREKSHTLEIMLKKKKTGIDIFKSSH